MHQYDNILWMLKLEDQVDDNKLTVSSMYCRYDMMDSDINNIINGDARIIWFLL